MEKNITLELTGVEINRLLYWAQLNRDFINSHKNEGYEVSQETIDLENKLNQANELWMRKNRLL